MDKKKLIGTIVGVVLFIVLIAGATFAWLTYNVNVAANGAAAGTSQNFIVNYEKGTNVTTVPALTNPTATTASGLMVSAYRASTSAPGTLNINLVTGGTSNAIITTGALNYAVCSGTTSASDCTGALTTGETGVLGTPGTVTAIGTKVIYTIEIPTTKTYYWIYFWLDASKVTPAFSGLTYTGYISATATQN